MNKSLQIIQSINDTLSDLGQIPEPAIGFIHSQPSMGKTFGWRIPNASRLLQRRKKRNKKK